jgi:hypothetical protein
MSGSQEKSGEGEKLPYASPRLVTYGDVHKITATMAATGVDGGTSSGHTFSM